MSPERVDPRRRDRGKDEEWIRGYLNRASWGVLALPAGSEAPYVNGNLFLYRPEPDRVYIHSARSGGLPHALSDPAGLPATFTAGEVGRLIPADEALEFSVEYNAVVLSGRCRIVTDPQEAEAALQGLLDKYAPHLESGKDYRAIVPEELRRTTVYRLDVERWSGKEKAVGEHPGAYDLDRVPIPFSEEGGGAPS
ncbi:MAG: pyridoxamine 5'-phosphate oxidase family protein [Gemmatimonadales bacterium]|nr:MAG: pyridoxamine 5'-phosphate oxidase family protein [Gemmatimonadales bacterium]